MQKVYRLIKKKRNLHRLAGVWLLLLAFELFCPIFCEDSTFATKLKPPSSPPKIESLEQKKNATDSLIAADFPTQDQRVCNDECLCHATAIPSFNLITIKHSVKLSEQTTLCYGTPVFNSLPPPYHPPKIS